MKREERLERSGAGALALAAMDHRLNQRRARRGLKARRSEVLERVEARRAAVRGWCEWVMRASRLDWPGEVDGELGVSPGTVARWRRGRGWPSSEIQAAALRRWGVMSIGADPLSVESTEGGLR